jgi:hypothetical protein
MYIMKHNVQIPPDTLLVSSDAVTREARSALLSFPQEGKAVGKPLGPDAN